MSPAEILGQIDLNATHLIVLILAGLLGILGTVFGWFRVAFYWIWNLFRRRPNPDVDFLPKKTVIILPAQSRQPFWWHMGGQNGKPSMQIVGNIQVTNIAEGDIVLSGVRIRKPRVTGFVLVENFTTGKFGTNSIPEGAVLEAMFDIWIQPPVRQQGEVFKADVCIFDQFGNEHWLNRVEFKYQ